MAQGRLYTVQFTAVAVTAQQDLFALLAASAKPLVVKDWWLAQTSDFGDVAAEIVGLAIKRGATNAGSGGSAPTPQPINPSDAAAGFTARVNDTTIANTGTIVTLEPHGWNVMQAPGGGFLYVPSSELGVAGGQRLVIGLITTPADSLTMSGFVRVEELG